MSRIFGSVPGVDVGQLFIDRVELGKSGVHRPRQAGICGTKADGAESIVISGGYEDDEDHGDYILYTGHGGRDSNSGRQISNQSVDAPGNAGLITSMIAGLPVRVTRGPNRHAPYSPTVGYQYAGLFAVTGSWLEVGRSGFKVVRFRLERLPDQAPLFTAIPPEVDPAFVTTTIIRRVRDSAVSRQVKDLYQNQCQICGISVVGYGDRIYSEGAHVRPLGRPHAGDDSLDNLLCLCPNHHTQLDIGGMVIQDNFSVAETRTMKPFGRIQFRHDHTIRRANVRYQRGLWVPSPARRHVPFETTGIEEPLTRGAASR